MDILDEGIKTTPEINEIEIGRLEHAAAIGVAKIKNARTAFIVLSVFSCLSIIMGMTDDNETPMGLYIFAGLFMCACYLAAVYFIKRRPKTAIISGLCFFVLINIADAIADPTAIYSGLILKAAVLYYLIKGIGGASELQAANEELSIYGQEIKITW